MDWSDRQDNSIMCLKPSIQSNSSIHSTNENQQQTTQIKTTMRPAILAAVAATAALAKFHILLYFFFKRSAFNLANRSSKFCLLRFASSSFSLVVFNLSLVVTTGTGSFAAGVVGATNAASFACLVSSNNRCFSASFLRAISAL